MRETTVDECVTRFTEYIEEAASTAERILLPKYKNVMDKVVRFVRDREEREKTFVNEKFSNSQTYGSRVNLCELLEMIRTWLRQVPLVGFNSQRYDLNVMKAALIKLRS